MQVTMEYVDRRFAQFAAKLEEVMQSLKFDQAKINDYVSNLRKRLAARDFKLYGNRPINYLHSGKRITRFYIKLALETCPSRKAFVARLQDQYQERVAEERRRNPFASFFSFEAAYASKLRVNLTPHRRLFMI